MAVSKHTRISMLLLSIILFSGDVAEGHFLASSHSHFWPSKLTLHDEQSVVEFLAADPSAKSEDKPKQDVLHVVSGKSVRRQESQEQAANNDDRGPKSGEATAPDNNSDETLAQRSNEKVDAKSTKKETQDGKTHRERARETPTKGDERGRRYEGFKAPEKQPKYPVIAKIHQGLDVVLGKYSEHWYYDWKLWVGLTLWLSVWGKWIKYGYDESYIQRGLFAFGLNIVILHMLQYASSIKVGCLAACALLAAQSLFQSLLWSYDELAEIDKSQDDFQDFDYDTMYLDLSMPVEQVVVLFVAQCCIWWFYMTSILSNFHFVHANYMFWLAAYFTMQMTMIFNRGDDSVLGNPFPIHDVYRLMQSCEKVTLTLKDSDKSMSEPIKISKASVIMRGLMGFFCNAILREIMTYTIPLMLMGFAEPMDFVVYCVGVNFICTIDDTSGGTFSMQAAIDPEAGTSMKASPVATTAAL